MKDYIKILHNLLIIVEREHASDLHIAHGRKPVIRVEGELITLEKHEPFSREDTFGILKAITKDHQIEKLRNLQELDFAYVFSDEVRLRSTAYMQNGGINFSFRVIERIQSLKELNLPDVLQEFARKEQGLFLIVGSVGQGKSTTMAAMIDMINKTRKEHIVTIEDPIEHLFDEERSIIDQREVGVDTRSFDSGLESVFRQDVDVIMVGEMRNPETISTVVTAAETGHLVFSTLHTNNAAQTIDRIIDAFPSNQQNQVRTQLASSLLGIFSQRLIKSKRGGMVPAYELMLNNKATANLIREGRTHEINSIIETGQELGMVDMNVSLIQLVRDGHISVEDAYRYSFNPKLLDAML